MSGPKSSRYTLSPEQRKALMISMAQQRARQERARLAAALARAESEERRFQALGEAEKKDAAAALDALAKKYAPLLRGEMPSDLDGLTALNQALRSAQDAAERETKALGEKRTEAEEAWKEKAARDSARAFDATLDSALGKKRRERAEMLARAARETVLRDTAAQAEKLLSQYEQAPSDAFRDTFFITAVQPFLKRHRQEMAQYEQEKDAYRNLCLRFSGLCRELGVDGAPPPWAPGAMKELEAKAAEMEEALLKQEEEAYIRRALDDVMREMGYPLLGTRDVTKRSGRRIRHALYTFEDGTAIDVTYSDDGQIAMELGGLDESDRLPDQDEAVFLCDAMEGFCVSFEKIEEKLRQRGVVLRERIRLLPPSEENAQIINTGDYSLTAAPSLLALDRSKAKGREKKKMYKDDDA